MLGSDISMVVVKDHVFGAATTIRAPPVGPIEDVSSAEK